MSNLNLLPPIQGLHRTQFLVQDIGLILVLAFSFLSIQAIPAQTVNVPNFTVPANGLRFRNDWPGLQLKIRIPVLSTMPEGAPLGPQLLKMLGENAMQKAPTCGETPVQTIGTLGDVSIKLLPTFQQMPLPLVQTSGLMSMSLSFAQTSTEAKLNAFDPRKWPKKIAKAVPSAVKAIPSVVGKVSKVIIPLQPLRAIPELPSTVSNLASVGVGLSMRGPELAVNLINKTPLGHKLVGAVTNLTSIPVPFWSVGLCGGMTYTVCDCFEAKLLPPETTDLPAHGTDLYEYIVTRQIQSMDLGDDSKIISWITMSDPDLVTNMTTQECPNVKGVIDSGHPCPLILVHGHATLYNIKGIGDIQSDLSQCHQVLAYGYTVEPGGLIIRIWDPDAPIDATAEIQVNQGAAMTVTTWPEGSFRGFFVSNYSFKDPRQPDSAAVDTVANQCPGINGLRQR